MDLLGNWKVTHVDHELGNIGVVVFPPIQSEFVIKIKNGTYSLHPKCWMNWGSKPIELTLVGSEDDHSFTGTVEIDDVNHSMTLKGNMGIGGRTGSDNLVFAVDGNPRGTGGAGRG